MPVCTTRARRRATDGPRYPSHGHGRAALAQCGLSLGALWQRQAQASTRVPNGCPGQQQSWCNLAPSPPLESRQTARGSPCRKAMRYIFAPRDIECNVWGNGLGQVRHRLSAVGSASLSDWTNSSNTAMSFVGSSSVSSSASVASIAGRGDCRIRARGRPNCLVRDRKPIISLAACK